MKVFIYNTMDPTDGEKKFNSDEPGVFVEESHVWVPDDDLGRYVAVMFKVDVDEYVSLALDVQATQKLVEMLQASLLKLPHPEVEDLSTEFIGD